MSERLFPIQSERGAKPHPLRIPWSVAELAYSVYSAHYTQSLESIARRGGFGPSEMDMFLPDWRERCDANAILLKACRYAEGSLSQVPDGAQVPPVVTMDIRDHLREAIAFANQ